MVGFRDFIQHLDPCFSMPSRKTIKESGLRDLHESCISKIKDILKNVRYPNVSIDGWSDATLRSFNGYTVQGIDENWNLINIPIGFHFVTG